MAVKQRGWAHNAAAAGEGRWRQALAGGYRRLASALQSAGLEWPGLWAAMRLIGNAADPQLFVSTVQVVKGCTAVVQAEEGSPQRIQAQEPTAHKHGTSMQKHGTKQLENGSEH
jgi:hypothetical protein